MQENNLNKNVEERLLEPKKGGMMLAIVLGLLACAIACFVTAGVTYDSNGFSPLIPVLIVLGVAMLLTMAICAGGFRIINPNEAVVLLFFGKYHGTIATEGFYWVNPFCSTYNPASPGGITFKTAKTETDDALNISLPGKKLSLKAMTLNNAKQKVNDEEGNPIEIGVVVIWRIVNTAKAVFNVENYMEFISTQADSAIRNVARAYPYDVSDDGDEKSLRGSSQEIADVLKNDLQQRVDTAGIQIIEARITHLAYAPEIAAAMLQRQQAKAIIVARQKIVEGAVGMVEMALSKLSEKNIVELDPERKAQMVSNLLVVLCGNKDAQPIVNSGSIA